MEPMKTRGVADLRSVRKRIKRLFLLGRVDLVDMEYIDKRLAEVEARIVSMPEQDPNGKEIGSGW